MKKSIKILLFYQFFLIFQIMGQGLVDGFYKGKGNCDIAQSGIYQSSTVYFAGKNPIMYRRDLIVLSTFAEYGVTNKWDILGNVPIINFHFQDVSFFTKYKLIEKNAEIGLISFTPALGFSTPLSNYPTEISQAIGQRATQFLTRCLVHYKSNFGWFIQLKTGYNKTQKPVPPSYTISGKTGFTKARMYIDVWYEFQKGLGDIDYLGAKDYNSFRELTVDYHQIGGVLYYKWNDKLGAFINMSRILDGRNIGKAVYVGTGIVIHLERSKELP